MSDWWSEWVAHHATVFGFEKDAEMAMLDSWRAAFATLNYSKSELFAATQALTVKGPKWRSEHLALIHDSVKESRALQRRMEEAKNQYGGPSWVDCDRCNGSAYVIVPLLKAVVNMEWVPLGNSWATCAVICNCSLGQTESERHTRARPDGGRLSAMTLGEYEQHNPNWRQQLKWHEEQVRADIKARNVSRERDQTFGPLIERIRQRLPTMAQVAPQPVAPPQADEDDDVPF